MQRAAQSSQRNPGRREAAPQPGNRPTSRTLLTFLAILAVNYFLMRLLLPAPGEAVTIPYTAFKGGSRSP
jgi:cell division protease FtsH